MPNAVARHQYPTVPASAALAREDCRTFLGQWADSAACKSVSEDLTLITSELVTNAVEHARGPVGYVIQRYGDTFRVEVRDRGSEEIPSVQSVGDSAEGGRGLLLVEAMSHKWGVRTEVLGVTVWAEVEAQVSER
uniref:ATP-binding protein n=1 Tax=Streptomyces sp. SS7 TaxID=3108485 RepID=UPI004040218B